MFDEMKEIERGGGRNGGLSKTEKENYRDVQVLVPVCTLVQGFLQ